MTYSAQRGFTLIEIAVVLAIIGLVLGGFLMPLGAQIEKSRRSDTQQHMQEIQESLLGFAMSNNRLPCPDSDGDGQEDRQGANQDCSQERGSLPYVTLGTEAHDAWGQQYTYHVTAAFADDQNGTGCAGASAASFSLCSQGDIEVRDAASGNTIAANVPALVVSHGKNWATATSGDELENRDTNDKIYVERRYSNDPNNSFDDMLLWVSPNILKNRMVAAGQLP